MIVLLQQDKQQSYLNQKILILLNYKKLNLIKQWE